MFRPCIDLHDGKVKQIVGSSLQDNQQNLETNFVSEFDSSYYAKLFQKDKLTDGHVIMLGPGNEDAAMSAIRSYPQGLQVGGGLNDLNAEKFLEAGAKRLIFTSWLFDKDEFQFGRLKKLHQMFGSKKIVIDLSCRKKDGCYFVVTNRWQNFTSFELNQENIRKIEPYCSELLIHAVDVEGKCEGVDWALVKFLADYASIPVTYAGGANSLEDLKKISRVGNGKVFITIGSALDIFGGSQVEYREVIEWLKVQGYLE